MCRSGPTRRLEGDSGTSLIELLIAMSLTTAALAAIVGLISSSSRAAEEIAADDPLAAFAADWLARDLRQATDLDVISTGGADSVTRLEIVTPDGRIEWGTTAGAIERVAPGETSAQPVVDGLRTTDALIVNLRTASDAAVDPGDAAAVDDCTRWVRIQVVDPEGQVLHERTVSVRYPRWEVSLC